MARSSSERTAAPPASSPSTPESSVKVTTGPSPLWPVLLILPWAFFIAVGNYGTNRSCVEGHWDPVRVKLYPGIHEYCAAYTRGQLPGTVLAVTVFFAVTAAIWVGITQLVRRARRRELP